MVVATAIKEDEQSSENLATADWKDLSEEHKQFRSDLTRATSLLLKHEKEGNMAAWAYLNGGKKYLEEFFNNPDYEGKHEERFLPDIATHFVNALDNGEYTIIEVGVGNSFKSKTSHFMNEFNKAAKGAESPKVVKRYIAIDIVKEYAEEAARQAKEDYGVESEALVADFINLKGQIIKERGAREKVLVMSFNSPIWNSPCRVEKLDSDFLFADPLRKLASLGGPKSDTVITHYPATDIEKILRVYESDACRLAVMAIPELIEKELSPICTYRNGPKAGQNIQFSDCFEYKVNFDTETQVLHMMLVSKDNINIEIPNSLFKTMDKGEEFIAVSSAKPSQKLFNELAKAARVEVHYTKPNPFGTIVGQLIHYNNS